MIGAKEWEHGSALGPRCVRLTDPAYPALHRPLGLLASLPTLLGLKGTIAHNAAVSLVWMLSALAEILWRRKAALGSEGVARSPPSGPKEYLVDPKLRTNPPSPEWGSGHSVAVRHPEVGHSVEYPARQQYFNSL